MKFKIVQYTDTGSEVKANLVQEISNNLENFFLDKNYGEDIETFLIGFLGIKTKPGYEDWYKERKPKYIDYRQTKNRITGEMMEITKEYSYDIKFDNELYDDFVDSPDEESKKILAKKILESLENLDKLPKKVKDFDKERFKQDMEHFFKEQNLL